MKSFAAAVILAGLIIWGSVSYSFYLDSAAEEMTAYSERIEKSIKEDDFDSALSSLSSLCGLIDDKKLALAATIDHNSIDTIERTLAELEAYLSEKQRYDAAAKCEVLTTLFKHLPKNYGLKLENIL